MWAHETGKDLVARGAAQCAHVGDRGQWHGNPELGFVPHEKNLISEVVRAGPAQILGLLTAALRRQDPERARWNAVSITEPESPTMTRVVEDRQRTLVRVL
jgi:hypothetical protein